MQFHYLQTVTLSYSMESLVRVQSLLRAYMYNCIKMHTNSIFTDWYFLIAQEVLAKLWYLVGARMFRNMYTFSIY